MTIDEEIALERKLADYYKDNHLKNEVREHEQLAEWLEELKILREEKSEFQIIAKDIAEYNYEMGMEKGYNKAIDDCLKIVEWDGYTLDIKRRIEQLKVGD